MDLHSISAQFVHEVIVLILEHTEAANEEVITQVVHFMLRDIMLLGDGVVVGLDLTKLTKVQQSEGELINPKCPPTIYVTNENCLLRCSKFGLCEHLGGGLLCHVEFLLVLIHLWRDGCLLPCRHI